MTEIVWTGCGHDCGGRCLLKAHVEGGVVTRLETDDREEPQLRACLRGRASRQWLYSPERLKYPMKRVGERGEGKFQRISWDEALDTVVHELKRVKEQYGPASIFLLFGSGSPGQLHSYLPIRRLLNFFGGCTQRWGGRSAEGATFAARATYGTIACGNTRDDLVNSRLIIMWGWSPAESIQVTRTSYYLTRAKEAGARLISVDCRLGDSAASLGAQWIPIKPGTDAAMLIAMAYTIIAEDLYDHEFIEKYTIGFDQFRDYVLGDEDGVAKTPAWAEAITGVPASTIESLAREYARCKPGALIPGFAPGRTAYGEQFHRAASILAAMTGNVGIHGGSAAGFERAPVIERFGKNLPTGRNPLQGPSLSGTLEITPRLKTRVITSRIWDALLSGKQGGYPADFKLLYMLCGNPLNQHLDINKGVAALKKPEFIVVHELFMTATAKFADIILPIDTSFERNDIYRPWTYGTWFIFSNKAIAPLPECKSDFEIACELAQRLSINNFSDKTEDEWLREIVKLDANLSRDISDYEEFKARGVKKLHLPSPCVAFEAQIKDLAPFPTPSGKIEIYSQRVAEINNPKLPPIPKYIPAWEGPGDPLVEKYPFQLITAHVKSRAHSTFDNLPWMKELEPQTIWINGKDAREYGIKDGDKVRVFNDRGELIITAKVTERIMPGVVNIGQGAWYQPDEKGRDQGGCPNVLTKDEYSPGGAFPCNTALVGLARLSDNQGNRDAF